MAAKSYILSYMCTAANFIIKGRMQLYGCRFCTIALGIHISHVGNFCYIYSLCFLRCMDLKCKVFL